MPHIDPRDTTEMPEFEEMFQALQAQNGYVPNSLLLLAWRPEIMEATSQLFRAVMGPGEATAG